MNILFSCAGRRNYLLHYFKQALIYQGRIIATDMQSSAPALAVADKAYLVPGVYEVGYVDELLAICKKEGIRALISLNDLELPILAAEKEKFKAIGTNILISAQEVIDICFDKWRTHKFTNAHKFSFKCPSTYIDFEDAKKAINEGMLKFPLVLKPRWGSASIGIEFPESFKEMELAYELLRMKLDRSILANASRQDRERSILIQSKIQGTEFGLDVLNALTGSPVQVYVKEKLAMRAGETDKAVLRNRPDLESVGFEIGHALGHIGNLDVDVFESDGKFYLLEMNPRFGGGYPFSQMAGADYPAALVSWIEGRDFDFSSFKKVYDQPFSKCDTLIKINKEIK